MRGGKISIGNLKKVLNDSYTKSGNDIDDYKIDNELTDNNIKVYKNSTTGEIVMVPKGTSSLGDVATDIKMAFGYKDKRFKDLQQKLNQIKSKYPNYEIDIAGHSLGAKVVEEIGANDDRVNNIYTLNKPTTPYDILFNRNKKNDKQIDIRSKK